MAEEGKGIALVILSIVAVTALVGLVLVLSGSQDSNKVVGAYHKRAGILRTAPPQPQPPATQQVCIMTTLGKKRVCYPSTRLPPRPMPLVSTINQTQNQSNQTNQSRYLPSPMLTVPAINQTLNQSNRSNQSQ